MMTNTQLNQKTRRPGVTAIVCAYNEETTLGGVLEALLAAPLVDEIIVVDDGSQDGTLAVIRRFTAEPRFRAVVLPHNRGKGRAMAEGILRATRDVLLFVDADLLNFSPGYVELTLRPLLAGDAAMVIGWPARGPSLAERLDPLRVLAGQRAVFRQEVLPLVPVIRSSGYGVETLLNLHYRRQRLPVQMICLSGLVHPVKLEKSHSFGAALYQYLVEGGQIARAWVQHYWNAWAAARP